MRSSELEAEMEAQSDLYLSVRRLKHKHFKKKGD